MRERDAILELWRDARSRGESAVLATVCEVKGSAYRRPGARMLLCAGGQSAGIISGGCLDGDLWHWAREIMATGEAKLLCYDTTSPGDIVWGLGLGCRGVVKILVEPAGDLAWLADGNTVATFFEGGRLGTAKIEAAAIEHPRIFDMAGGRALVETLQAPPPLWIFGAGRTPRRWHRWASALGWDVRCDRPAPPARRRRGAIAGMLRAPGPAAGAGHLPARRVRGDDAQFSPRPRRARFPAGLAGAVHRGARAAPPD